MTVIAWDGETLSADKRTSFDNSHGTSTKIFKRGDLLVGGSGQTALIIEMREWILNGGHISTFPVAQRDYKECAIVMVIKQDGSILQYEHSPYPLVIENRQWAIGCGADFATMAMHLGKSSREAVELTSLFSHQCGNGVDTLNFSND